MKKIEIIIVEDDEEIANGYKAFLLKLNKSANVVSQIVIIGAESFLNEIKEENAYRIFITDSILHPTNFDKGKKLGLAVRNRILELGKNPIFIRSGNLDNKSSTDKLSNEQIKVYDKTPLNRNSSLNDMFERTIKYYEELKRLTLNTYVMGCLDPGGNEILDAGNSVENIFRDYHLNATSDSNQSFFIARSILLTPMQLKRTGNFTLDTKEVSWEIMITNGEDVPDSEGPPFLSKVYDPFTKTMKEIIVGKNRIDLTFKNPDNFKDAISALPENNLTLDQYIIDYFITYRIADLYLEEKLTADEAMHCLRECHQFGKNQEHYENVFITYLWEKLIHKKNGTREETANALNVFHNAGFILILDVFYCQINDEVSKQNQYVSTEVKSADFPSEPILREYEKTYIKPDHLLEHLKCFKIIHYQSRKNTWNTNSNFIEEILQEEFKSIEIK